MDLNYFSNWKNKEKLLYDEIYNEVSIILGTLTNDKKDYFPITFTYIAIPDKIDLSKTHYYFIFLPFITGIERKWKEANENGGYALDYNYSFCTYPENNKIIFIKDSKMMVPKQFYEKFFNKNDEYMVMKYNYYIKKLEFPDYIFVGPEPPLVKIEGSYNNSISALNEEWFSNKQVTCKFDLILEFTQPKLLPWVPVNIKLQLQHGKSTFFKLSSETQQLQGDYF